MDGAAGEVRVDMSAVTVGMLVGCAVALVSASVASCRQPARLEELRPWWVGPTPAPRTSGVRAWWARLALWVGTSVRRLARRPPDDDAARRLGGAVLIGGAGCVIHPVIGVLVASVLCSLPVLRVRRERLRREREIIDGLPDVIDLFRLAAGAGLTVRHAVDAVSTHVDGLYGDALAEVRRQAQLGVGLADALDVLRTLGDPVLPFHLALVSCVREGAPLASPLERVSAEARQIRRRATEERVRRLPVQLLFPLVLCILPAFGLLTVVPLLAGTLRSLSL